MDTRGIDQMLSELRATSQVAAGKSAQAPGAAGGADFGEVLKSAIDQVSSAQMQAQEMAKGFSAGDPNVNLWKHLHQLGPLHDAAFDPGRGE